MGYLVHKSSIVAKLFGPRCFRRAIVLPGNGAGDGQMSRGRAGGTLGILGNRSRLCERHELVGYNSPVVGSVLPRLFFLLQGT